MSATDNTNPILAEMEELTSAIVTLRQTMKEIALGTLPPIRRQLVDKASAALMMATASLRVVRITALGRVDPIIDAMLLACCKAMTDALEQRISVTIEDEETSDDDIFARLDAIEQAIQSERGASGRPQSSGTGDNPPAVVANAG